MRQLQFSWEVFPKKIFVSYLLLKKKKKRRHWSGKSKILKRVRILTGYD